MTNDYPQKHKSSCCGAGCFHVLSDVGRGFQFLANLKWVSLAEVRFTSLASCLPVWHCSWRGRLWLPRELNISNISENSNSCWPKFGGVQFAGGVMGCFHSAYHKAARIHLWLLCSNLWLGLTVLQIHKAEFICIFFSFLWNKWRCYLLV